MRIRDYFNPCCQDFTAWQDFRKLSSLYKIATAIITGLSLIVPFGFLGSVALFRFLVGRFRSLDLKEDTHQAKTAKKLNDVTEPLLGAVENSDPIIRRQPPEKMCERTRVMRAYLAEELRKDNKKFLETIDNGDCFFDAVAQTLSLLDQKITTIKEVRQACHEYIEELNQAEDNWLEKTIGQDALDYDYKTLRENIQYTAEEALAEGLTAPIWGDATIAKIICKIFDVKVISHTVTSYEIDSNEDNFLEQLTKCLEEKRVVIQFKKEVEKEVIEYNSMDLDEYTQYETTIPSKQSTSATETVYAAEVLTEISRTEHDERKNEKCDNRTIEIASYQSGPTGHILGVCQLDYSLSK